MLLAEMREQAPAMRAIGRFAHVKQRIELRPLDLLDRLRRTTFVDHPTALGNIAHAVGHPGVGRQPVAPCPARLLVIGLDARRKIEMGDETHIRLVDPHAEGDGRDENRTFVLEEGILMPVANAPVETGVIGERLNALRRQPFGGVLDLLPAETIDDAARPLMRLEEIAKLRFRIVLADDGVADVRAVEARGKEARVVELRRRRDKIVDRVCGSAVAVSADDAVRSGKLPLQDLAKLQIFRPEVVAPLRAAVRLVDEQSASGTRDSSPMKPSPASRSGVT